MKTGSPSDPKRTRDRLADDLAAARAPGEMVQRARDGYYDDYDSPLPSPVVALVKDLRRHGLYRMAAQAVNGAYDATKEESDAWAARMYVVDPELRRVMDELGIAPPKETE